MRIAIVSLGIAAAALAGRAPRAAGQSLDPAAAMHWRSIGPTRAGRARALDGVPGHPALFYVGFDNGGVWRSSDYGANWEPIFDAEPTGSIGAIAVAPSAPNVIYVGTGAGIIRPDLATGDGMYKSTDAGRTWTHLGLDSTADDRQRGRRSDQPRPAVRRGPRPPVRTQRRARHLPLDRRRPLVREGAVQGRLHQRQRRAHRPARSQHGVRGAVAAAGGVLGGRRFRGGSGGIFKSTDGGTTWSQLTDGLPTVLEANLAIAPSNPQVVYAMVAAVNPRGGSGPVAFYRSSDGGAHWMLRTRTPGAGDTTATADARPLARIGGGDLPTITVDPKDENAVYSASVVMWRTEDGGASWSAVRGSPGGDDYQKVWVSPVDPEPAALRLRPGRHHLRQSGRVVEQLVHAADGGRVPRDRGRRLPVSRVQRAAGLRLDLRGLPLGRRRDHVPRLAPGQHPGIRHRRAGPARPGRGVRQRAHRGFALRPPHGPDHQRGSRCGGARRAVRPQRAHHADPLVAGAPRRAVLHVQRGLAVAGPCAHLDADQPRPGAPDLGGARERGQVRRLA